MPEADLAAMQRSGRSDAQLQGWVLRMRGLPFTATAADVVKFFEGLELARGAAGVVFTCTSDGRPLGEAYVEFTTEEAQQAAHVLSPMQQSSSADVGQGYIRIYSQAVRIAVTVFACVQYARCPGGRLLLFCWPRPCRWGLEQYASRPTVLVAGSSQTAQK